ncbi:hypothetical protein K2173_004762 [Erythroxylum novogranatense]|uniref:Pectinesterase n=1 Tax=Erythroxylum novogranatense TaxID=1862640 RepID=A0AAV8SKF3_9ROSI|nr:hypothetical protein K2173_004762 [Erythroxylum novogranatense]
MSNYGDDGKKKKRIAIIGVSSFLLVAMVVAVTVGVGVNNNGKDDEDINGSSHKSTQPISASVKAIKAICQPAEYKKSCEENLKKSAGNTTDPKELIQATFEVAQNYIIKVAEKSTVMQDIEKDPRAREALQECRELMNMSMSELQHSFERIGDFDLSNLDELLADLSTWLTASLTFQETCLDGFDNTTGDAGEKMRSVMKTATQLTSIALDIVSGLSSIFDSMEISGATRRLLTTNSDDELPVLGHDDQFPEWVKFGTRRLLALSVTQIKPDLVVAKDGSGDFKTINEAIMRIGKRKNNATFVLYIKEGVYQEYVSFNHSMDNLIVIGDGGEKTRITGNRNVHDGYTTYGCPTVIVSGDNFLAMNIGVENTAGPDKHQAVALRSSGDDAIFYNCTFDGYQDTLYAHVKRQFYRDCTISGTIDFVFGAGEVAFQNCTFLVRKPMDNQQNIVTAQGRKQRRERSGFIIQNSTITAHPDLFPVRQQFKSYLGRPWKPFSRTIIMESFIDDVIQPDGWTPWSPPDTGMKTCWYTEFNNYGPGADKKARVTWNGIKNITREHAIHFTPGRFLRGDNWIKPTGVPYIPYWTRPNIN